MRSEQSVERIEHVLGVSNEGTARSHPAPRMSLPAAEARTGSPTPARLASAMMDLSDGLSSDLPRLCSGSGVGARIETGLLPVTSEANRQQALKFALHGGEDYELLFTVSRRKAELLPPHIRGVKLTCIGQITREPKILLLDEKGALIPLRPGGWDPFRDKQAIR